ncbi:pseudaminic acid cytidylyltransferase [Pseudomonas tussilaginis]|uniref:pseudaminic acid cytidylyltransferase n=1 Tax=Pseudomonas sp. 5 TaxID=1619949 RepID=UPI0005EBD2A7|nr:pseudaminic acid cytidylyltransferase [Pseudomonas sp. 5]KJK09791.1 NeuA [Pseudomonas sp. 5]
MKVAIIPARGGSKRIPRKNIKFFAGRPMIEWSIDLALRTGIFDRVVVSTDDDEIAETAISAGAEVPFRRPLDLADDHATTVPVIAHAITELEKVTGNTVTLACCIYPCSPFTTCDDIVNALHLMDVSGAPFAYPITEFAHPIQRAMLRSAEGKMTFMNKEAELMRTQDLATTYHDCGQFYWGRRDAWLRHGRMHSEGAGYVIPSWRVVDIDTGDDWVRAELMHRLLSGENAK